MVETTRDMWGVFLTRGIAALLFGIAAVFWPGITLVTLVYLFSAYILVSGIMGFVSGLASGDETLWVRMMLILVSILEFGIGVYLLRHPFTSFATLVLLIGFALIIRGLFEIVGGLFTETGATHRLLSIMAGLIAGIAGVVVLLQPAASGVAFVWILGLYALLSGPLLIAMAFDIKNNGPRITGRPRRA